MGTSHLPVHDIRSRTPESSAVKFARSQLEEKRSHSASGLEEAGSVEEDSFAQNANPPCEGEELEKGTQVSVETKQAIDDTAAPGDMPNMVQKLPAVASPPTTGGASANKEQNQQSELQMSNDASYDNLEKAVVDASTPPKSNPKFSPKIPAPDRTYDQMESAALQASSPPRSAQKPADTMVQDDPIAALDELEDAVEKINAEVPEIQASPEKKPKKAAPVVRTTKASQARISLAHGPKDNRRTSAIGKPRQSLATSQNAGQRVSSTSSIKSEQPGPNGDARAKRESIIPHSKPRPMSMQFKPPPPPARSTKAPTTSTFQLPGEAVAAKLKAAKEARMQKDAEDHKKKSFKARPAPSMGKTPTVRQTSTSKARESLMNGKPLASSVGPKRPASVATFRPTTSIKPAASAKPAVSSKTAAISRSSTSRVSAAQSRPKTGLAHSARPSSVMGTLTNQPRPRTSLTPKPNPPGTTSSRPSFSSAQTSGTAKAKVVFARTGVAKPSAEKEKREREEAAKKARADAAERSRLLSREWAEKQRAKKAGATAEAKELTAEIPTLEAS